MPESELRDLLAAAKHSTHLFQELAGTDRALIYALAMTSGYRAGELGSLEPGKFDLYSEPPTARVRAAYNKNRKESVQPIPADVAMVLRNYLIGRPISQRLWPGNWHEKAAEMLRVDLEAAGIPYEDGEGHVADFHACGTVTSRC